MPLSVTGVIQLHFLVATVTRMPLPIKEFQISLPGTADADHSMYYFRHYFI